MGKRSGKRKRRSNRKKKRSAPSEKDASPPHPLGDFGTDWNDDFAFIAGWTGWGYPYGVSWAEADWLEDDPEFGEWVRKAREEEDRWAASEPASRDSERCSTSRR